MNIINNENLRSWNFVTYFYVFSRNNTVHLQILTIPNSFGFPSPQDPP